MAVPLSWTGAAFSLFFSFRYHSPTVEERGAVVEVYDTIVPYSSASYGVVHGPTYAPQYYQETYSPVMYHSPPMVVGRPSSPARSHVHSSGHHHHHYAHPRPSSPKRMRPPDYPVSRRSSEYYDEYVCLLLATSTARDIPQCIVVPRNIMCCTSLTISSLCYVFYLSVFSDENVHVSGYFFHAVHVCPGYANEIARHALSLHQGGHPGSEPALNPPPLPHSRSPKVLEPAFRQFQILAGNLGTEGAKNFLLLYGRE